MKYYFIRKTVTYKKSFTGTIVEYIYGLRENLLAAKTVKKVGNYPGASPSGDYDNSKTKYFAEQYSFKSESSAKKVLTRKTKNIPENELFDFKYEVITVEI